MGVQKEIRKGLRPARFAAAATTVAALVLAALPGASATAEDGSQSQRAEQVEVKVKVQIFKNRATGSCLDDSEYNLRALPCGADNPHQRWTVYDKGGDFRVLKNVATGRCLDDSNEEGLRTFDCGNGAEPYQRWKRRGWQGGIELLNEATGRCLDHSHEGLRTFGCNGGQPYQLWY
ncbi:RICIN domain-containing protein [Streptomyces sp. NBC_00237]|uniref:RICIN domain-containing protein n=1 Tax=Streptomyces sp. NBC_00237 TaxID=2975687 RepID=UPI00225357B6|nr:ricin-type beta-trefoil lectin domain protein [Streptomyces sp. NBC_00237]MCX5205102.1 RICIN domain-containing protein [Streptomyces sp. NBC_00237]